MHDLKHANAVNQPAMHPDREQAVHLVARAFTCLGSHHPGYRKTTNPSAHGFQVRYGKNSLLLAKVRESRVTRRYPLRPRQFLQIREVTDHLVQKPLLIFAQVGLSRLATTRTNQFHMGISEVGHPLTGPTAIAAHGTRIGSRQRLSGFSQVLDNLEATVCR